ncbi:hypothetical protein KDH_34780 [Dictyobacter sp. S3.2.2.5]|uniref:Uncharacterized protein n=1 Tax=Dictyobacter halimunensis TaxID=3026934 RepID=A0ABQ6FQU7_9CHLR|nr:hypothetical protein KDH_34780 [Dictyobacter sp. S3.2.2.5]
MGTLDIISMTSFFDDFATLKFTKYYDKRCLNKQMQVIKKDGTQSGNSDARTCNNIWCGDGA